MSYSNSWKQFWDEYDFDHGPEPWRPEPGSELEKLREQELLNFIDPRYDEMIFDAGCGTGRNILLLSSKVKQIVGMDYSQAAIERCQRRIDSNQLRNVEVKQGSITQLPLSDRSINKVLCMSVLQYMDDIEVTRALTEFKRILCDGGVIVLHVKNLSSLYLSTLWAVKRVKLLLHKKTNLEYYRSFRWYVKALRALGFEVVDYNSFNLLMLDKIPRRLTLFLQKLELQNYNKPFLRLGWLRRHGSELKIKARLKRRI